MTLPLASSPRADASLATGRSRQRPNANAVGKRKYEYQSGYSSMLCTATRKTMTNAARWTG